MLPSRENVSRCSTKLIHFCKKLPLGLDYRQRKHSLQICNIHIFLALGVAFAVSFLLFSKAPGCCGTKILKLFLLYCTFICISSKIVYQILKILFQTGDIDISDLHGVFLRRYIQLKSSFFDKKSISGET